LFYCVINDQIIHHIQEEEKFCVLNEQKIFGEVFHDIAWRFE
jgi:hypothetical protein